MRSLPPSCVFIDSEVQKQLLNRVNAPPDQSYAEDIPTDGVLRLSLAALWPPIFGLAAARCTFIAFIKLSISFDCPPWLTT